MSIYDDLAAMIRDLTTFLCQHWPLLVSGGLLLLPFPARLLQKDYQPIYLAFNVYPGFDTLIAGVDEPTQSAKPLTEEQRRRVQMGAIISFLASGVAIPFVIGTVMALLLPREQFRWMVVFAMAVKVRRIWRSYRENAYLSEVIMRGHLKVITIIYILYLFAFGYSLCFGFSAIVGRTSQGTTQLGAVTDSVWNALSFVVLVFFVAVLEKVFVFKLTDPPPSSDPQKAEPEEEA